jgi:hypothetical protein
MKKPTKPTRSTAVATKKRSGADRPISTTDKKTGLPVINCRRAPTARDEMTPERLAEILLAQEVGWFHEAGSD